MTKIALLMGLNYRGSSAELSGCIHDVVNTGKVLEEVYGYKSEDILYMTDDSEIKPTARNILAQLIRLSERTYQEDIKEIWVSYSGHGTYVKDVNDDEDDGKDESLVPLDYKESGMISDDRQNGTSAIYFSRPISRIDYTAMKFLSVAVILAFVIIFSYFAYYTSAIVFRAEGWAFLADTLPMFLGGILAGLALVFTYTSIGLALSSISQSRFFAAIGFLSIIYGTKLVSLLVELQFETTFLYAISPYDCLAHLGQFALGLPPNYDHPLSFSVVSLISMNVVSIWILVNRVTSLEVTRE